MLNLSLNIQLSNVINLLLGVVLGFFIMVILACAILSKTLKKYNKTEQIRDISSRAYTDYFSKQSSAKDKLLSSITYEIKEVSTLCHPDKDKPIYELSINDVIFGLKTIQKKLKKIVTHPLCKDIKNIHITTLLELEEKIAKPVLKVSNNKFIKIIRQIINIFTSILNLINPIFYIRKIMNYIMIKRGKKDLIIISLDFIGNTTYEIYNREKDLQKTNSNL